MIIINNNSINHAACAGTVLQIQPVCCINATVLSTCSITHRRWFQSQQLPLIQPVH